MKALRQARFGGNGHPTPEEQSLHESLPYEGKEGDAIDATLWVAEFNSKWLLRVITRMAASPLSSSRFICL